MTRKVVMPLLGEGMERGTIAKWLKGVGEVVSVGDVLLEVETDKSTLAVESFVSGFVREIISQVGEIVPVGQTIALITDTPDEPVVAQ